MNISKSFFLKNYDNKIDKPVANLIKSKGAGEITSTIRNGKRGNYCRSRKCKIIILDYFAQPCSNKFQNMNKTDDFL